MHDSPHPPCTSLSFWFCLEVACPRLTWNPWSDQWPWTMDSSPPRERALQLYTTMPDLCNMKDGAQGFVCATQALYQPGYLLSFYISNSVTARFWVRLWNVRKGLQSLSLRMLLGASWLALAQRKPLFMQRGYLKQEAWLWATQWPRNRGC